MIYPKIIMGYKATPHKIVRNIDGEWYESRPTKEIWPAGSDVPDVNGEYAGGYDCAYRWFPIGKDYPKGEWYEIKHNLYGWKVDLKPGQKPLSAYYWHIGEPEPTFHEYKHVDGILKYVKTTYKESPFRRNAVRFEFDIEPVEQARPRATRFGKGIRLYDPKKVKVYKQNLGYLGRHAMQERGLEPFDGELTVRFEFYRPVQASLSQKERARRLSGVHRPTVKPDLDNYIKSTSDALNGILWADDNCIVSLVAEKYYADKPHLVVEVNK